MKRFLCVMLCAIALVCTTIASNAQGTRKNFRIGFVALVSESIAEPWIKVVHEELSKLGYEEGKNLTVLSRFANGNRDQLKDLVVEIAGAKVDVFLTAGEPALMAAKAYGEGIPIVTVTCDPIEKLIGSLARPGGNATGFTCISSDLGGKRLGLLKDMLPKSEHIAVLYSEPDMDEQELKELEAQGRKLGLEILRFPVRSPGNFEPTFKQMVDRKSDAVYIASSSFANLHRGKLAELALGYKLPAMYGFREFAEAGGLITYGAPLQDGFRRAADHVNKILKGALPADIAVEQPTKFELVINLKTAKALVLTIPPTLLALADAVIE